MLFTALIGPYVVNWTAYRDAFEREASAYIGRPVSLGGKVGFRLLPTPVLSFTDVRVGDTADPDVRLERFRAEVELAPLLKGEVRVLQMILERPQFRFDLADLANGEADGPGSEWRVDPQRISVGRLEVVEGTAVFADSRAGHTILAERINALVEAGSLRGPARIDGDLVLDGQPLRFGVGLGRLAADGTLPARVAVSSLLTPLVLTLDGNVALGGPGAPNYAGALTLAAPPPDEDDEEPRPAFADFGVSGPFSLTPDSFALDKVQLSYGATERPLILQASGRLDFGPTPRFDVSVGARQVDVDRALGAKGAAPVPIVEAVEVLFGKLRQLPEPPFPGQLRLAAQGVVVGGSVLQGVGLDLQTGADGWQMKRFAAVLPGDTELELRGDFRTSVPASFKGHGRLKSGRPAAFAAWWNGQVGSAGVLDSLALEADLDIAAGAQRLANIVAATGSGTAKGTVELRRFEQSGQQFVTVDLSADRAELAEARALAELFAGTRIADRRVDQMTVSLRTDTLVIGDTEARSVVLEGGLESGEVQVSRLAMADIAGASLEARGSIHDPFGKPSGRLDASVKAENLAPVAELMRDYFPEHPALVHLHRLAPALSPVQFDVSAEGGLAPGSVSLDLTGSFAESHLTVSAIGQGSLRDPKALNGTLTLHADGTESTNLFRQLGLDPVPTETGPFSIDADFSGALSAKGSLNVAGRVAGVDVSYKAETHFKDGGIGTVGEFEAESGDLDPALMLTAMALPGIGEGHAASVAGRLEISAERLSLALDGATFDGQPVGGSITAEFRDGITLGGALHVESASVPTLAAFGIGAAPKWAAGEWPDAQFAPALPPGIAVNLQLTTDILDLGLPAPATEARLGISGSVGRLNIDLTGAKFGGGQLKGAIAATLEGGEAEVAFRGGLQGGQVQGLVWEHGGLPIASGHIDLSFDLAGHGRSMAGVVSTLAGSGSFSLDQGRINALNPGALDAVMEAVASDEQPDEGKARETFAIRFGSGALPFGRAAGSFSVAAGVLTVPTVSVATGTTTVLADATVDLNGMTLASQWSIRSAAGGPGAADAQPSMRILFSGPIADPERQLDLSPLLDLLRSRYLQRQLDQIQELEQARQQAEARQRAAELLETQARERAEAEQLPPQSGEAPPPGPPVPAPVPDGAVPAPAPLTEGPVAVDGPALPSSAEPTGPVPPDVRPSPPAGPDAVRPPPMPPPQQGAAAFPSGQTAPIRPELSAL